MSGTKLKSLKMCAAWLEGEEWAASSIGAAQVSRLHKERVR